MDNQLDKIYTKLRGKRLVYEDQCTDGVMLGAVIRHRLGLPQNRTHPYFDHIDMVGPGEETILSSALGGRHTIDDLIKIARKHLR